MDKFLDMVMKFVCKYNENIDEDQAEIIKYGLELLTIKVTFIAALLVVGYLMNSFWECLIFIALFSGIRSYAGGYHADTRWKCFIESMLTFAAVLGILKLTEKFLYITVIIAVLAVISAAVIIKFAPVDTENKRLDDDEKRLFRKKTIISLLLETAAAIVSFLIGFKSITCSVMLAVVVTAILMSVELITHD